jgi:hypothetical protein
MITSCQLRGTNRAMTWTRDSLSDVGRAVPFRAAARRPARSPPIASWRASCREQESSVYLCFRRPLSGGRKLLEAI